ncbi:MAG: helix-turn-helix domain-containing protein [Cyclobacteriaceae bacterium]
MNKKKKILSDKILAVWMFVIGVHLFLYYLFHIGFHNQYPHTLGLIEPFPLLHGPLLFLYVHALIQPRPVFRKRDWLHAVPAIAYLLCMMPDMILLTGEEKLQFVFEQIPTDPPFYIILFDLLIDLSGVVYVISSLVLLRRHQKNIKDNFSDIEKINLKWLRALIVGMAGIWLTVLVTTTCGIASLPEAVANADYIYVAVTIFIFLIGYFGFRQGAIFSDNTEETFPEPDSEKPKYVKSSLTSEKGQKYLKLLKALMTEEKPYLESKITLKQVSDMLDIHPNHLSQIINEYLNQSFYDMINSYRVEEVKYRLKQEGSRKLTLLAHAYDSGFSSKSSFNEVFKKATGMTPSTYQKQMN